MKKTIIAIAAAVLATGAMAADIEAGKAKAASCVGCHGANGISMVPMYPNLKGQKAVYLEASLKAFKDKSRTGGQSAMMYGMVAALSETDMANIAAYYESLGN